MKTLGSYAKEGPYEPGVGNELCEARQPDKPLL